MPEFRRAKSASRFRLVTIMVPVPVILVGLSDKIAASIKQEFANQGAEIEAEYRSADTAIEGLRGDLSIRHLLIAHVESAAELKDVRRLAEILVGWPIIALVEVEGQAEILLQANRAGASQVVPLPLVSADLQAALICVGIQQRAAVKESLVIAITGSAAGCGATTLATNVAYEMASQRQRHVVLIELAQRMGVIATNLDVAPVCTLADLLADPAQLDGELVQRSLIKVSDNLELLAGSQGVISHDAFPVSGVLRVLDYIRPLAEVIILDVPCTYSEFQFEILGIADQVVVIGEQSIASIRTLKLMLDSMPQGAQATKAHIVINRYDPQIDGLTVNNLTKTLGVTRIYTVPDDRPSVLAAANEGKVLRQTTPHSPVVAAIGKIVEDLLGVEGRTRKPTGPHLLRRLFSAFRK